MATLATLSLRHWRLQICGLRHGTGVEPLKQLLEDEMRSKHVKAIQNSLEKI